MGDEDYAIQPQTIEMLRLFREGADRVMRDVDAEPPMQEVSDILHSMTFEQLGICVIDLLTLFCELEHRVLDDRARRLVNGE